MNIRDFELARPRAASSTAGWGLRAGLVTVALWSAVLAFWPWEATGADRSQIERGKYLVTLGSCADCHTLYSAARELLSLSVTSMAPGLCVMHSDGRAASTATWGVTPQAQNTGSWPGCMSGGSP